MGEVVALETDYYGEIPPETVCGGAAEANLKEVLVVGHDVSGNFYLASSSGDIAADLLLVELARDELMAQARG